MKNSNQELNVSKDKESTVLHEMMLARKYMAKAASHARKVSESYESDGSRFSNHIATSYFDLTISLINSMNESTNFIDVLSLDSNIKN